MIAKGKRGSEAAYRVEAKAIFGPAAMWVISITFKVLSRFVSLYEVVLRAIFHLTPQNTDWCSHLVI